MPAKLERHETVIAALAQPLLPIHPMKPLRLFIAAPTRASATLLCLLACINQPRIGHTEGIGARLITDAAESEIRSVAGATASHLSLTASPLDPRLRLPACDQPLHAFIPDNQVRAHTTVGVRCEGSVRWTIYTSIAVETEAAVLIARYALPRDANLAASDVQLATRRVPGLLDSYLTDVAAAAGQRLKRPVAAGEPLTVEALAPALLIRRGQQVVLLARSSRVEVRMAGTALADARASDHIRVQNLSSQRIVEGIVRPDGVIETPL